MQNGNIRWLQWGVLRRRLGLSHYCTLSLGKWPWSSFRLRERCTSLRHKTGVKIGRTIGGLPPWKINWAERGTPWAERAWAFKEECLEHHGLTAAVSVSAQLIDAQQTAIQGRNIRKGCPNEYPNVTSQFQCVFMEPLAMHLLSTKPSAIGTRFGCSLKLTSEAIN